MDKFIKVIGLALVGLLVSTSPYAAEDFPKEDQLQGKKVFLNGQGMRKKKADLGIWVSVYKAGLYLENKTPDATNVVESTQLKKFKMVFVRDVEKEKITASWTDGFKSNNPDQMPKLQERLGTFNTFMANMAKDDTLSFEFGTDAVEVKINDRSEGVINGKDFLTALLRVWFGPKPTDDGIRKLAVDLLKN